MHNKSKDIWNKLAPWWDEAYGEGDIFHRTFLFPTIKEWVSAKLGMRILDLGCGNGALARLFAKRGAEVLATDFSETFIERAKLKSKGLPIEYRIVDAADSGQLKKLISKKAFDCIICSMVLHNLPTIKPMAKALPKLLKPSGKFIFSVPHPCFNSGLTDIQNLNIGMDKKQLFLPNQYIKSESFEIFSKPNQPVKQMSFHRPLSQLFDEFFRAGLVMTGFVEPVAGTSKLPKDFLWAKLSEIPPAIITQWKIMLT